MKILQLIFTASGGVADKSELFIRAYQMYKMFDEDSISTTRRSTFAKNTEDFNHENSTYIEFKVAVIAIGSALND